MTVLSALLYSSVLCTYSIISIINGVFESGFQTIHLGADVIEFRLFSFHLLLLLQLLSQLSLTRLEIVERFLIPPTSLGFQITGENQNIFGNNYNVVKEVPQTRLSCKGTVQLW